MAGESPLSFGATVSLAATAASGNTALPTKTSNQILVSNTGPDKAYIRFGADNTVTVTANTGAPIFPGAQFVVSIAPELDFVAAICPTSTATLEFTAADGYIAGVGVGSTGASGGIIPGTGASNLGKAEDALHTSGDVGIEMLGVRRDTPSAVAGDGDYSTPSLDQYGDQKSLVVDTSGVGVTYLASINGGTPVTATGNSFLNIAAGQATTVVKSGAGVLKAIIFNGPATATSTTTIYDNTAASGTIIGIPLATAVVSPVTINYNDLAFSTGLTIITATANGANMTVIYR